jgi:hypothetical protein
MDFVAFASNALAQLRVGCMGKRWLIGIWRLISRNITLNLPSNKKKAHHSFVTR